MIFLLVLFALFILYSFFFDKSNKRPYNKAAVKSETLVRQPAAPTGCLRVIETAPGQTENRRTSEGMRPNLRLIINPTHQSDKK
ncbi:MULTISPECIES: hypothetical protein [Bacillus]|uniref:hypothetical protein n=1 Tax=Bacillus TaxID=1386 RepID=UPI00040BF029|nr:MULTISPECIES: hypothetical protein [Bacillus]QHZ45114.1 hypothetical protein M654_001770 [Bacillus sp. NSP9.1]WFA05093.1 hypothetical protein P3X63_21410 [Bacillus sp. HSf4]